MSKITNVCFGIQARSSSSRLPGKALKEVFPGRPLLQYVMEAAESSIQYLNRKTHQNGVFASLVVLCPSDDPLILFARNRSAVIEGPLEDVLSRYKTAADQLSSDYMVRITADCPRLPPKLLSSAVLIAVRNQYDYCSNVFEPVRTATDGHDIEIMSRKALEWANQTATSAYDREHVTSVFRVGYAPNDMKMGCFFGPVDESDRKCSIDTEEEFDSFADERRRYREKYRLAEERFGREHVHRI